MSNPSRVFSCSGKQQYATHAEALKARARWRRRGRIRGKVTCYHCKFCGQYHLGRKRKFAKGEVK